MYAAWNERHLGSRAEPARADSDKWGGDTDVKVPLQAPAAGSRTAAHDLTSCDHCDILVDVEYIAKGMGFVMAERYVTISEAADRLRVSHDTVLRLVHSGSLPAIRVSQRLYRIPRPALDRFESGEPIVRRRVVRWRTHEGVKFGAREGQASLAES